MLPRQAIRLAYTSRLLTPFAYTTRLLVRAQLVLVSPTLPTLRHTWHGARGTKNEAQVAR